jgi:hypothetical protein
MRDLLILVIHLITTVFQLASQEVYAQLSPNPY